MLPPLENLIDLSPEARTERLLAEREGQWFDRKSNRIAPRELAVTLVAMANAEGGIIAVGLHSGVCEGVRSVERSHNGWRQAAMNFTSPPVRCDVDLLACVNKQGDPDQLFIITVYPGDQLHVDAKDDAYLRVGDQNRRLTFEQRLQLRYDRWDTGFEISQVRGRGSPVLDDSMLLDYASRMEVPDPIRLLQARGVMDSNGEPFTAGELLFGVDPSPVYPQAFVRVLKYAGTQQLTGSVQNLVADTRCEGPLPLQVDKAQEAVRSLISRQRSLGPDGRFDWYGIVPEEVWLEALVNAVIHRAYSNFGDHIRVILFDDRIEVFSPGRFPGLINPIDLMRVPRFARNPRIARVMSDLSYGQELGEGLRRMVQVMESTGRQRPVVEQTSGGVLVTLLSRVYDVDETYGLPDSTLKLLRQMAIVERAQTGELAGKVGISRPVALRSLRLLESRGLVRHVAIGPTDPKAYWIIEGRD
jgi:ATP-dependent DNA helicase RecG